MIEVEGYVDPAESGGVVLMVTYQCPVFSALVVPVRAAPSEMLFKIFQMLRKKIISDETDLVRHLCSTQALAVYTLSPQSM